MYKHHEESIQNLISYYKNDEGVIAVILGGSVAKGCERLDSDIDAMVVVTEEKYKEQANKNAITECISGYCTYEGGYFDIKYYKREFLKAAAQKGSEPARNAFLSSKCLYTKDPEIPAILSAIPVFQRQEKDDKMLSFYSALMLNVHYFWAMSKNDIYLRTRAATDIVLFSYRLLLQENEVLFPCGKSLLYTVSKLSNKPEGILEKSDLFLHTLDDATKDDFVNTILSFLNYQPPKEFSEILTRYTQDNELWWYQAHPLIAEW